MMNKGLIVGVEISLLVLASFAFSYMIRDVSDVQTTKQESIGFWQIYEKVYDSLLESFGNLLFSNLQTVSAFVVYTCPLTKNGTVCQQFDSTTCQSNCNQTCIPSASSTVGICAIGTCYDTREGTCTARSPRWACENSSGMWYNDPLAGANVVDASGNMICRKECCVLGSNANFVTDRQCQVAANRTGLQATISYPDNENDCLNSVRGQEMGACVYEYDYEKSCRFVTRDECRMMNGEFSFNYLCSNPTLNVTCTKENSTGCVDGSDEIYWFDSCGNRENIYDANRDASWNNGLVLPKAQSCSVSGVNNPLANQRTCGNCNYVQGSKCGVKTDRESLADGNQGFVCKDLSCVDEKGIKRANGESWCLYDGTVGDSKDVVGSRYYRRVCQDGEVTTEPCADYRNEVCVSGTSNLNGTIIQTGNCRINLWQECLQYNQNGDSTSCSLNSDCIKKTVFVDSDFTFDVCVPKYPEGFDLGTLFGRSSYDVGTYGSSDNAQQICSMATQTCTMVETKELDGEWECKNGCGCATAAFDQQMNDYCTSLGDCGMKANWVGDVTANYDVKKKGVSRGRMLSPETFKQYALPKPGQSISDAGGTGINDSEFANRAEAATLNALGEQNYDTENPYSMYSTISGVIGAAAGAAVMGGFGTATMAGGTIIAGTTTLTSGSVVVTGAAGITTTVTATTAAPIVVTGGSVVTGGTLGGGAVAGTVAAGPAGATGMAPLAAFLAPLMPFLIAIAILAIAFMIYTTVIGWGKSRTTEFKFVCQPWIAPVGGSKCDVCNQNPIKPCSKYRCESLGTACQFLNEGTGNETCVAVSMNDASAPVISPDRSVLTLGYNYVNVNSMGYKLQSNDASGCLKEFTPVMFGISLDEPGRCRVDTNHTTKYDSMSMNFGENNLFLKNHSMVMLLPSLESLGIFGSNPTRTATFNLFVRCEDARGNKNVAEYDINFCIQPSDDHTAPAISGVLPVLPYLSSNATSKNVTMYTNEPASCRWSSEENNYDSMANNFVCANGFEQLTQRGWACNAVLPTPLRENDSSSVYGYYVRCKDQPWLEENDTKRNANAESFVYTLTRTSELKIDSVSPNNQTILISQEPASIELLAMTSGGYEGGGVCSYKIGNTFIDFAELDGHRYRQVFTSLGAGDWTIPIRCTDMTGNSANAEANFRVEVDSSAPIVTRVYNSNGLVVVTDENSICSYSNSNSEGMCDFANVNASQMSGSGIVHSTGLDRGKVYYIRCVDGFGNAPNGCSIVVQGGLL